MFKKFGGPPADTFFLEKAQEAILKVFRYMLANKQLKETDVYITDLGGKYLVLVSFRVVKMRDDSSTFLVCILFGESIKTEKAEKSHTKRTWLSQFVYFLRKMCLFFNF